MFGLWWEVLANFGFVVHVLAIADVLACKLVA